MATITTNAAAASDHHTAILNAVQAVVDAGVAYTKEFGRVEGDRRYSDDYRGELITKATAEYERAVTVAARTGAAAVEKAVAAADALQRSANATTEAGVRFEAIPVLARQFAAELMDADRSAFPGVSAIPAAFAEMVDTAVSTEDRTALHALVQLATERGDTDLIVKAGRGLQESIPEAIHHARALAGEVATARARLIAEAYRAEQTYSGNQYVDGWMPADWTHKRPSPLREILEPGTFTTKFGTAV